MTTLTMLDAFSGIGGFSLAGRWAGFETVAFVEIDPFCQAVLRKHWPEVPLHADIRAVDGAAFRGVTLVTGGFPCQPVSNAGRRQGDADDRWLWPALRDVVATARPRWVVAENVRGLLSLGHEQVCLDLEAEGYQVGTLVLPAIGVDAPHRRERVWIVAHDNNARTHLPDARRPERGPDAPAGDVADRHDARRQEAAGRLGELREDVADAVGERVPNDRPGGAAGSTGTLQGDRSERQRLWADTGERDHVGGSGVVPDADESGRGTPERDLLPSWGEPDAVGSGAAWLDWDGRNANATLWAVEPPVGRVAHGIPRRVDRLRSLGNAIVPHVAYVLLDAIAQYERSQPT